MTNIVRRVRASENDAGAYAILYAMLVVVLFGMAAMVVDLASLRLDRSDDRSATDSAATAGARVLIQNGPQAACQEAYSYAFSNLGITGTPNCSAFPTSITNCPASSIQSAVTASNITVRVSWPVLDTDPDMTNPDVKPGDVTQSLAPNNADGGPCGRVEVSIERPRTFAFAGIFGGSGTTTMSTSIALGYSTPGNGGAAVPLVVLDPNSCDALVVNGGAQLLVAHAAKPNPDTGNYDPGRIAVDSDGTGGDVNCNGGSTTIDADNNDYIRAQDGLLADGSPGDPATIYSYAITANHLATAYKTSDVAGCVPSSTNVQGSLCPVPVGPQARVGTAPFDNRYNCSGANGCPLASSATDKSLAYIDQLTAFATSSGNGLTSYTNCSPSSGTVIPGNVIVKCPGGFTVKGTVIFTGTTVVFTGDVQTQGNGSCLMFGVSSALAVPTTCASPATKLPVPITGVLETVVYVAGALNISANNAITAPQTTFVVQKPFNVGGTAYLSAPYGQTVSGQACAAGNFTTTAPNASCFEDLVLWDPYATTSSNPHTLSGGGAFSVSGALYMPNGAFKFTGSGTGNQTSAQFVAKRITITGGGQLQMIPDATRQVIIPVYGATLIR